MERLTMHDDKGVAFWKDTRCSGGGYRMTDDKKDQERLDRLAAYEDTGLEPEEVTAIKNAIMGQEIAKITEFDGISIQRLQEISKAKKDGRLVVPPCKVGDRIYQTDGLDIYESEIWKIVFDTDSIAFDANAIGKTVFLTREEAEAALKNREEADNQHD